MLDVLHKQDEKYERQIDSQIESQGDLHIDVYEFGTNKKYAKGDTLYTHCYLTLMLAVFSLNTVCLNTMML